MCGERDEIQGGDDVMVASDSEARAAIAAGLQPVGYSPVHDCLLPWHHLAKAEAGEAGEPSEASCADWSAGFIGLKPRRQVPPPPPLSIPLRALAHRVGSAPLIEHLAYRPRRFGA